VKPPQHSPDRARWRSAGRAVAGILALSVAAAWSGGAKAGSPTPVIDKTAPDRVALRAQLGIIYAQNGQRDEARQEFVKLMEESQGRAAALTNLGNLSFLDGKVDEALASYQQASALDTKDAGILLNQGLALKQLGRGDEAEKVFATAVQMAGGVEKASYLLGIAGDDDTGRGKVSKMTADEVRQMLLKAKRQVPDTRNASKTTPSQTKVTSRPGGARAADVSVGEQNLYWKDR
jgi:tetratricopeptide (TPR) repeat protein